MTETFNYINNICYYHDCGDGGVLVWHSCTDTPVRMNAPEFYKKIAGSEYNCPLCNQFVLAQKKMTKYGPASNVMRTDEQFFLKFKDADSITVGTEGYNVRIDIFRTEFAFADIRASRGNTYRVRFNINVRTGRTYIFDAHYTDIDKHMLHRREIYEISYMGAEQNLPDDAMHYVYDAVRGIMIQVHGGDVPEFETYGAELTLNNLVRYVRNPYICPVLYGRLTALGRRQDRYSAEPLFRELSVKNTCRDPITQMLRQSKVPQIKSIKRLVYRDDEESLPLLISISRTFKNADVIRKLCRAFSGCSSHHGFYNACVDFSAEIFKKLVKHKGETVTANKLISLIRHAGAVNAREILCNMINDYRELENFDFDFDGSYDIHELHVAIALAAARQEEENRVIDYSPRELSLVKSGKEFFLEPAKDTFELIEVGAAMNICVGMYANSAVNKDCSIFVLREHGGKKPIGCIELDEDSVVQAKGVYNSLLSDDKAEFVKQWIADNGLQVKTGDIR